VPASRDRLNGRALGLPGLQARQIEFAQGCSFHLPQSVAETLRLRRRGGDNLWRASGETLQMV
jgi:hypothetical protein